MDDIKVISGTTSVYKSSKIKDFQQTESFPLAWEIILRNDKEGRSFARDLENIFLKFPKEKGLLLDTELDSTEPVRCMECVFKDRDSFKQVINQAFKNRSFIDEEKGKLIPKLKLFDAATKELKHALAIAC